MERGTTVSAVVVRLLAELRRRWRASLLLAALLGLVGGVAIAAFAGARRTSSSFDRMIEAVEGWDVLVNPDAGIDTALDLDAVGELPEVTALSRAAGVPVFVPGSDGLPDFESPVISLAAMDSSSFRDHHRPLLRDGRLPEPTRADEVLLGPGLATELGVAASDEVELLFVPFSQLTEEQLQGASIEELPIEPMTFVVTGIGLDQSNIVVDEAFADDAIVLTSAFYEQHANDAYFISLHATLRDGASGVPSFRAGVEALAPAEPIEFQTLTRISATVDRAVRPQVVALVLFGLVAAVAGLLVLVQSLSRHLAVDGGDADALAAIGMTHRQRLAVRMVRVLLVGVVGAVLAAVVAIGLSGRAPIGPARTAEPSPGVDVDGAYVWTGALVIPVVLLAVLAVPQWRASRHGRTSSTPRPSFIAGRLAAAGAGPVPVVGVRMAVRPLLFGVAGVLAALVGVFTFAAGMSGLLGTPERYGWAWHHLIDVTGELPEGAEATALAAFERSDDVQAMALLWNDRIELGGEPLPAIGIERLKGDLHPTIVEGRAPQRGGEIALGSRDLDRLDAGIGDLVVATTAIGDEVSLEVVGQAVFPGIGTYSGADRTELARGAVVTVDELRRLGAGFDSRSLAVSYVSGAEPDAVAAALLDPIELSPDVQFLIASDQQPGDVVSLERVRGVPLVLAGLLAVLAAAGLAHGLLGSVRRGRRDLAVLATIGFTRRQVAGAVAWQAATVAVVALVVAIPLGVAAGRAAWTLLADGLGIPPSAPVPLLALGAVVAATAVVAMAVTVLPARRVAHLRPAVVLRTE